MLALKRSLPGNLMSVLFDSDRMRSSEARSHRSVEFDRWQLICHIKEPSSGSWSSKGGGDDLKLAAVFVAGTNSSKNLHRAMNSSPVCEGDKPESSIRS